MSEQHKIDYPFIIRPLSKEDGGGYLIEFPDLPGCISDGETIEEVYEPFLIQEGFLMRTPRGREATEKAYKHLGKIKTNIQGGLF